MKKSPLLFVTLLLAPLLARAQVELVYKTPAETLVITSLSENGPMYEKNGCELPIPREGEFEVRPATGYAKLNADISVQYRLAMQEASIKGPAGRGVTYRMGVENDANELLPPRLYYIGIWQVGEKITHLEFRNYSDGTARGAIEREGFRIQPGQEDGFLRMYLMLDGRSVGGIATLDVKSGVPLADYLQLKSALDAGDLPAVQSWARAHPAAQLPSSLAQSLAAWGDVAAAEALLADASVVKNLSGKKGGDVLQAAILAGRKDMVEALLRRGLKAGLVATDGRTPVMMAAEMGNPGILGLLLDAGGDPNERTFKQESSAFQGAMGSGSAETVEVLLKHGAKWPTARNALNTCAALAIQLESPALLEQALKNGADANDIMIGSPLIILAAQKNQIDLVRILVTAGAKVSAPDKRGGFALRGTTFGGITGGTALMEATFRGNAEIAECLIKAGAKPDDTDDEKHSAIGWALKGGHAELACEMVTHHVPGQAERARLLAECIIAGEASFAGWLRSQGVRLDVQSDQFEDAINEAIRAGDVATMKEAMADGVSGNRRIKRDWTLAAVAQRYGKAEILELFRAQSGDKLDLAPPAVSKLPLGPVQFRVVPLSKELKDQSLAGEAKVDFFVDYEGRPMFPVIRSSTDPRVDRFAIQSIFASRFNALENTQGKAWRRAIAPVIYKEKPDGARGGLVYLRYLADQVPVIDIPSSESWAFVGAHAVDVALAEYLVNPTGEVTDPAIVATSTPAIAGQALAIAREWRFRPALKSDLPVVFAGKSVIIMPEGRYVPMGVLLPLETPGAGFQLPRLKRKGSSEGDGGALADNMRSAPSAVLLKFKVGKNGKVTDIKILAATNAAAARVAEQVCKTAVYEPGLKDGVPAAMTVLQCVAQETPGRFDLVNP